MSHTAAAFSDILRTSIAVCRLTTLKDRSWRGAHQYHQDHRRGLASSPASEGIETAGRCPYSHASGAAHPIWGDRTCDRPVVRNNSIRGFRGMGWQRLRHDLGERSALVVFFALLGDLISHRHSVHVRRRSSRACRLTSEKPRKKPTKNRTDAGA